MAIELKEYVGAVVCNVASPVNDVSNLKESYTQTYIDEASLMVDIEAIHSIVTRNGTLYTPQCIKDSVPYWTDPYERPVIMHHNEKDGKIIGRVKTANYIEKSKRSDTAALELIVNIGDEEGKKGIKNGTLATVSIGAIAHDIRCSICGQNLVEEGMCEHDKGETYDGKMCYWIVNKIEPKEISYVIVPSDVYAHNTRVYDAVKKNKNNEVKESMNNIFSDLIKEHGLNSIEVTESKVKDSKEGTQVDEEVKDGATTKVEPKKEKKEIEVPENPEEGKKGPKGKQGEPGIPEKKEENNVKGEAGVTEDPLEPKTEEEEKEEEKKEENNIKTEEEKEEPKEDSKEEELKAEIEELKKTNSALTAKVDKLVKALEAEKALKESAEAELIGYKADKKKSLVETINTLRTQLSLPQENVETLIESSEESLNLTIKSLNEFVQVQKKTLAGLTVLESPISVSEEKDNTISQKKVDANVKESAEDSNNNFESQLMNIMSWM